MPLAKSRSKSSTRLLPPIASASKATSPELEDAPLSARSDDEAPSANAQLKAKRGRRKKNKTKDSDDQEPLPTYSGPPPTEELLDVVLSQVKWRNHDYFEPTYNMIREGETEIGCEVNTRNGYGFTPLAVAAAAGDNSLVALLLERRADASLASLNRAELPIHHAATNQHSVVAQLLVEPSRKAGVLDARTCTGWTPLHLCCSSGDALILKILLKAKANLDTRNPQTGDEHALHCAARSNNLDIVEILLAAEADVNCTDSLSRTPLHLAATSCYLDGVSLLLRSRGDPLHRGGPGFQTPIECVPAHHKDEVAKEKVLRLLNSYSRPAPQPFRVDTRFDLRDDRSLI